MFLAHRTLHPATAVTDAFWARFASTDEELLVARGHGLECYGVTGDGSLRLQRRWEFEGRVAAAAAVRRPGQRRDGAVLAFEPARLACLDVDDARADGQLRQLRLVDLAATEGAGASADLRANDAAKARPLRAPIAARDWPIWLGTAADGSVGVVRCLERVVACPLPGGAATDGAEPFFCDEPLRGRVARHLAFRGAGELLVVAADARGDAPESTAVVALGLDCARRSAFVRWRVDKLAASPTGFVPLRAGGACVFFRHSCAVVAPGGAVAATALNGFAEQDWSPTHQGRHRLRPNAPALAVDACAGVNGCEVADGVLLVGLPGAVATWVVDVTQSHASLRPLASGVAATVFAPHPTGGRVFMGGGLDDGVLCDVSSESAHAKKKVKLEAALDDESSALYGPATKVDAADAAVSIRATDALLGIGAVLDCAFAARVGHRWPFQPQREGDGRRAAAEARASGRAELVTCSGSRDGARGHVCCLGAGVRPPCVAACALDDAAAVFGGCRWRGPFRGVEGSSREVTTRDVIIVARRRATPRWFLFDGATFSEHALDVEARPAPLAGVVPTADPLDAAAPVYLAYADGWLALEDGEATGQGKWGETGFYAESVQGRLSTSFVTVSDQGAARVLTAKGGRGLQLGATLFEDVKAACVCRCPEHLFFGDAGAVSTTRDEAWPAPPDFDEATHLYRPPAVDVKKEKGSLKVLCLGVDGAGSLKAARLGDEAVVSFDHVTSGHGVLGTGDGADGVSTACAVACHKIGPALALDGLGCWVLAVILEEGDVMVYWRDVAAGAWRLLRHDFVGRPAGGPGAGGYAATPFDDVESRAGVFLAADRPALLLCERGAPAVVLLDDVASEDAPPDTTGAAGFAALPTARGFLMTRRVTGASEASKNRYFAAVCSGLGNAILAAPGARLTAHKAPLDAASPDRVRALGSPPPGVDAAPAFACLCATPRDGSAPVVDPEAEPSTEPPLNCPAWPLECLHDQRLGGVPPGRASNRHEVRLVSGLGWRTTQRCLLEPGERGLCMDVVRLAKPKQAGGRAARCAYVCVGTSIETGYGEDAASRGRVLLLEVDYVAVRRKSRTGGGRGARAGHVARLRPSHEKKLRGACSGVAQVQEHVICAIANRVEVYALKDATLQQIATHHAPHYVVSMRVAKNYIIYADVYQSAQLLFWRDRDRQLFALAKDMSGEGRAAHCSAADFVVDAGELAGAHALGIVVGDGDRVRLLQYAPLGGQLDRGGQKLLARADYRVGTEVQALARHKVVQAERVAAAAGAPPPRTSSFACVYGGRDGRVGALLPVDERVFRRLGALAGVMGNALRHEAALPPDKHLLQSPQQRNVLDGDLVLKYASLDRGLQDDLARAVGTERRVVLDNLLSLDTALSFV